MLDFIKLGLKIKHKIKVYVSGTHNRHNSVTVAHTVCCKLVTWSLPFISQENSLLFISNSVSCKLV